MFRISRVSIYLSIIYIYIYIYIYMHIIYIYIYTNAHIYLYIPSFIQTFSSFSVCFLPLYFFLTFSFDDSTFFILFFVLIFLLPCRIFLPFHVSVFFFTFIIFSLHVSFLIFSFIENFLPLYISSDFFLSSILNKKKISIFCFLSSLIHSGYLFLTRFTEVKKKIIKIS